MHQNNLSGHQLSIRQSISQPNYPQYKLVMHLLRLFVFAIFTCCAALSLSAQADSTTVYESHKFDFWLGEWDVYRYGTEQLVGRSRIESIIDSIGILENYRAVSGSYQGKSLNKYNPKTQLWQQFWIDNSGLTLELTGGIINGSMVMANRTPTDAGTLLNRITWTPQDNGEVRQIWETSRDEGTTWVAIFDGIYKPRQ